MLAHPIGPLVGSGGTKTSHYFVAGDKPEACSVCGKKFRLVSAMKKHMLCHSDPQLQCPHCPKRYRTSAELKVHSSHLCVAVPSDDSHQGSHLQFTPRVCVAAARDDSHLFCRSSLVFTLIHTCAQCNIVHTTKLHFHIMIHTKAHIHM